MGKLYDTDAARLREIIGLLTAAGFLERTEGEYPILQLGRRADELLTGSRRVTARLRTPERKAAKPAKHTATPLADAGPPDEALYEALRQLRARLADRAGVPAYAVFTNATLLELAVRRPTTGDELMMISGIGQSKCDRWGKAILALITSHESGPK